jgi:hypothetical protein
MEFAPVVAGVVVQVLASFLPVSSVPHPLNPRHYLLACWLMEPMMLMPTTTKVFPTASVHQGQ